MSLTPVIISLTHFCESTYASIVVLSELLFWKKYVVNCCPEINEPSPELINTYTSAEHKLAQQYIIHGECTDDDNIGSKECRVLAPGA